MFSLNCNGKFLLAEKPLVMGILNITDDSFFKDSRLNSPDEVLKKASQMIEEGADILDVGGQTTRPGSQRVSAKDEIRKVVPIIHLLKEHFSETIISIDTYHSEVAVASVAAGASIVNDISGGEMDKNMIKVVAGLKVPYVCMHMKGVPETMHLDTNYKNVLQEVLDYFIQKVDECKQAGIKDVVIDPGFGFGKDIQQNLFLLKNLKVFKMLEKPILCGLSRKSTIYKTLKVTAQDALNGTTVLNTLAIQNGAGILRVHDVKEAVEVIKLMKVVEESE
ncbi:MAG: dihydropteroate synthase [Ginsengibacter sp.]